MDNPYLYIGPNPTVDLVILNPLWTRVLLIKRGKEPHKGMWALPGGFQNTNAKRGEIWQPGAETAEAAAIREAQEETGLAIPFKPRIVGVYEGGTRDPRDTETSWSRSTAFVVVLPEGWKSIEGAKAGDDAADVQWFDVAVGLPMAFDHLKILGDAMHALIP